MAGEDEEELETPTSTGRHADPASSVGAVFGPELTSKFEIYSYRNAAGLLATAFPNHFAEILQALESFTISRQMIRQPGGSRGPIAQYVDELMPDDWVEARISADLRVRLHDAKKREVILKEYWRDGYLDGHRIDYLKGRVALDVEWNSKDQTYDRDLYAFSAFYQAGAIDVGVILTRGSSLDGAFFRSLGNVLKKDGSDGTELVMKKFGASTTWMGKLLYRLDAGRNAGCPVLAVGITPRCVSD